MASTETEPLLLRTAIGSRDPEFGGREAVTVGDLMGCPPDDALRYLKRHGVRKLGDLRVHVSPGMARCQEQDAAAQRGGMGFIFRIEATAASPPLCPPQ